MIGGAGGVATVCATTTGRGSDMLRDKQSFSLSLGERTTGTGFKTILGRDNGGEGSGHDKSKSDSKELR